MKLTDFFILSTYIMLSEQFLIFVATSGVGAFLIICRLLYKSKCKNFELCCLRVQRDAEQENHADLVIDMARRLSNSNDKSPLQEPVIRYENIYKGELPKKSILDNKKIQESLSSLEEGIIKDGLSNIPIS